MKAVKALVATTMAIALLAAVVPAAAGAAAYKHYVACGISRHAHPSHVCDKGSKKGAFFKSLDATVSYSVCVKFPSGKNRCAHAQQAEQGTLYVNVITSSIPGRHVVTWFVKGKKVGAFAFRVKG
jgi:hypothetical protein